MWGKPQHPEESHADIDFSEKQNGPKIVANNIDFS